MKKDFWYSLLIWFLCISTDQATKKFFALSQTARYNEGFIFGSYADLPVMIRILTMSTLYGFIFFLFFALTYFPSSKFKNLKWGLALLVGGIGGNVFDRTFSGKTLDFIPFPSSSMTWVTFNLSDLYQSIGAAIVLFIIIFKSKNIWPQDDQRGKYVINPLEQIRFAFKMSMMALSSCLVVGIFSFAYWRLSLNSLGFIEHKLLVSYIIVFTSLSLTFTLIAFLTGMVLSHKTVGPLYAFELYVEDLLKGEDRPFSLREGDHYKHLEKIANDLRNVIKK